MSTEISIFTDKASFEDAQRMAKMLASSDLVPESYRETGNGKGIANTMIALNMSKRTGSDPMMIMQNLYMVHGRPGWSSQFIIAALNSSGRFKPLQFVMEGDKASRACYIKTTDKEGNELIGPTVTMEMAKAEGWLDKKGSKWQTMPELMLRYRAAAFFGRLYAPDVLMGMQTAEELQDIAIPTAPSGPKKLPDAVVEAMLAQVRKYPTQEEVSKLSDALTAQNVDPQQSMDIISLAQEIVDSVPMDPPAEEGPAINFRINNEEGGKP
jgi:hypothetical protein